MVGRLFSSSLGPADTSPARVFPFCLAGLFFDTGPRRQMFRSFMELAAEARVGVLDFVDDVVRFLFLLCFRAAHEHQRGEARHDQAAYYVRPSPCSDGYRMGVDSSLTNLGGRV